MIYSDLFREAWVSITASRLRAFLAMLGIVIGVGSVILMMAIGTGSRKTVQDAIDKLGSNLIIVSPGNFNNKGVRSNAISRLTVKDAEAIAQVPLVLATAPATSPRNFQLNSGSQNWSANITGTTPDYFAIRNWQITEGDAFTSDDLRLGKRVAVIGTTVATSLYGDDPPVGRVMRVNGIPFTIVGLLGSKGQGFDGRDEDNNVFVPLTTAQSKLWGYMYAEGVVQTIFVQAVTKEDVDQASEAITELLRKRGKLKEADPDNFNVRTLTSLAQTATDITRTFSMLLGAIAGISLVVGGIGIMNIMLVTVTERTREIGIRKAIGAARRHILIQFLLEAIIISGVGSTMGFFTGLGFGIAAEHWLSIPVVFSLWSVALALAVAVGVGLFSGLYPAIKAAHMEPIEALRTAGA